MNEDRLPDEFLPALEATMQSTLKEILCAGHSFPHSDVRRYSFHPDGSQNSVSVTEPDIDSAQTIAWGCLEATSSRHLQTVIASHEVLRHRFFRSSSWDRIAESTAQLVGDPDESHQTATLVSIAFDRYFQLHPAFDWGPEAFADVCVRAERLVFNESVEMHAIAPVDGLSVRDTPLELADDCFLRTISDEEKNKVLDLPKLFPFATDFHPPRLHRLNAAIVGVYERPSWGSLAQVAPRVIEQAVTVLRLLKAGQIGTRFWWKAPAEPALGQGFGMGGNILRPVPLRDDSLQDCIRMEVGAADTSELRSILASLRSIAFSDEKTERRFNLALRRFDLSYERSRLDDQVIDCMIPLEALFASDNKQGEIAHRVSRRTAVFLRATAPERKQLYDQMKKLYNTRSKIVHGSEPSTLEATALDIENVLRETIRKILKSRALPDAMALDFGSM